MRETLDAALYDVAQAGYFEGGNIPDAAMAELAAVVRATVEAEIVAWLRREAVDWMSSLLAAAADAIEAGEHREKR